MKQAKVLLINPDPNPYSLVSTTDFGAPMGILAIGTYLKHHGIDVVLIDARLYKGSEFFLKIEDSIGSVGLIGLSVMTAQIREALMISKYIKSKYKDKKIVWGGVHPTLFPQQTLANRLLDFIVIGEGEIVALDLIRALENVETSNSFSKINGLGFKDEGELIINRRHELMDMDKIPFQAYELLEVEKYINVYYPFIGPRRELLVQTSRGCPHRCAFCINYVERSHNTWRCKNPKLVLEELYELKDRYKLNAIGFRDENMFVERDHAIGIISGLHNSGLNWCANVRADYFSEKHLSEECLRKISDAGVAYLGIGAESGSDRILRLIYKDITVDNILFSAAQLNKHNITASYSFITGIPGETRDEISSTLNLMKKLKKICPRSIFAGPQILRPYPSGSLYDLCVENGYRSPQSLEEWANKEIGKFGELSMKNYPWIKHVSLVTAFSTYVPAALNYDFMKNLDFSRKIYSWLACLRLKFNFWFFPYEYHLAKKIIKIINIFNITIASFLNRKAIKTNVRNLRVD